MLLNPPPRLDYDAGWLYRLSERYGIPVSRLELTPSEMECEIGLALGERVTEEAHRLAALTGKEWTAAMHELRKSKNWIDGLILEKYEQLAKQKARK